jgi:hypothetical protein
MRATINTANTIATIRISLAIGCSAPPQILRCGVAFERVGDLIYPLSLAADPAGRLLPF